MTDKQQIYKLFDSIADRYELVNHVLSCFMDIRWRKHLASKLPHANKFFVLDICCGSGSQTIAILRNCKEASCTGIDLSEKLLIMADNKLKSHNFGGRFLLQKCDAAKLPFSDKSFDYITASFGIRNIYDLNECFSRIYRILNDQGQFLILEFSMPERKSLRFLFQLYLNYIVPSLGWILTGKKDAYNYLKESITNFSLLNIPDELIKAKFRTVSVENLAFGAVKIYTASKAESMPFLEELKKRCSL